MEVFIVYEKDYIEDTWGYPQGKGIQVMKSIYSVRSIESAAKEDIRIGGKSLDYCKQVIT